MKKILLSLLALMSVTFVSAQELGGYTPVTSNGTFTPLEDGTVVNAGIPASDLGGKVIFSDTYSQDSWSATTGKAFPIGFDFPFNGKTFSYFVIGANGAVKLSEAEEAKVMFASWNICFSTPDNGGENLIMAYDKCAKSYEAGNEEGKDTTVISYKNVGDELVVEYKNLGINTSSWGTDLVGTYNLQIRLKNDGTITYVYSGLADLTSTSAGQVYLGVKGADDGNGNRDLLTWESLACKTKSWNSPSNFNLSAVADGYTITLNTPGEVVAPTVQPSELNVTLNTELDYSTNEPRTLAQATFTAVDGADKYLMLIKKGNATDVPEDGVTYEKGGQCGDSYVMYAGTAYNFNIFSDVLEKATTYTVSIFAYNSFGKGGPKYNTVDAPSVTLKTSAGAPNSMELAEATTNSLKIAVEPNDNNDLVYVVYNDKTWNPANMGSRAYTGTPNADAQVGDALYTNIDEQSGNVEEGKNEEAGKVAYFGGKGSFELTDLEPGKSYYFIAYSYDSETKTFTEDPEMLKLSASTNIVAPYKMDLTDAPATFAPGGWTSTPDGNSTGFWAKTSDYRTNNDVSPNTGDRCFQCVIDDSEQEYALTSPVIEVGANQSVSFDWHIHKLSGWGYFASPGPLDPEEDWAETDYIKYVLYVDGEEVELKKIDATNAPADETAYEWHSETFDLSQYAGKNVQFGIKWLCATYNTYLGFNNFAVNVPTMLWTKQAAYTNVPESWGEGYGTIYTDDEITKNMLVTVEKWSDNRLVIRNWFNGTDSYYEGYTDVEITYTDDDYYTVSKVSGSACQGNYYDDSDNYFWTGTTTVSGTYVNLDYVYVYPSDETGYIYMYHDPYTYADYLGWSAYYITWDPAVVSVATGINNVNAADNNAPVYNIAGQRVNNNAKGIVIKNGKKYLNK